MRYGRVTFITGYEPCQRYNMNMYNRGTDTGGDDKYFCGRTKADEMKMMMFGS